MEDSDEKARRNLLIVSSLIVLIAWLGVPMDVIVERVLGANAAKDAETWLVRRAIANEVEAWRVWFAIGVLLLYVTMRFRFASETGAAWTKMRQHVRLLIEASTHRRVRFLVEDFPIDGVSPAELPSLGNQAVLARPRDRGEILPSRVSAATIATLATSKECSWKGSCDVLLSYEIEGRSGDHSSGPLTTDYALRGLPLVVVVSSGCLRACLYSTHAVILVVPIAMCAAAWLVVASEMADPLHRLVLLGIRRFG